MCDGKLHIFCYGGIFLPQLLQLRLLFTIYSDNTGCSLLSYSRIIRIFKRDIVICFFNDTEITEAVEIHGQYIIVEQYNLGVRCVSYQLPRGEYGGRQKKS